MLSCFFSNPPAILENPVDWDLLLSEASAQGVLPALKNRLASGRLPTHPIPVEILEVFTAAESLNAKRNKTILAEAIHAAALLNQLGIQPVALKGLAYLLTGIYPNPGSRYLVDVDLLLKADDIPRATDHLYHNGYYQNESARFLQFRHHHPAVCRAGSPNFELHQQVILGRSSELLPAAAILANAKPLQVEGATFLIPSPTDLANHLILHSQLAHPYYDRIFPPLRALIDLTKLQQCFAGQIDWHALAETYRLNHESATLILHLHQAQEIVGFQIPEPIPTVLSLVLRLRYQRRAILNRHPSLRFLDPSYIVMSLFSRRLRLLPLILQDSSSWPHLLRLLTSPTFYRKLIG